MKRLILSLFLFGISSLVVQAQQAVQKAIDNRYVNAQHQNYVYLVDPFQKEMDNQLLEQYELFQQQLLEMPVALDNVIGDTTWSYSESKSFADSMYTPGTYTHYINMGDTVANQAHYNEYTWFPDSSDWLPGREQTSYFSNNHADSSITYYYNRGETEPYLGYKYKYPVVPSQEADYESIFDYYYPETGWIPNKRNLTFRNELEYDTLSLEYTYNPELMDYQMTYRGRFQYEQDYQFLEYSYFYNGEMTNMQRQETTNEFLLSESYNYNNEGEINNGTRGYTLLRDDGAYVYTINKAWGMMDMKLVNEDSTHYFYLDNNTRIEAEGYFWDDSVWIYDELYTTFQREVNEEFLVDSIIIYDVDLNEETGIREPGAPYIKSEMYYDGEGNQIEVRNFQSVNDTLKLYSITKRKYKTINGYPNVVYQESYVRDFATGELYLASINEQVYKGDEYNGSKYFNLSAAGDTTNGYVYQYERLPDGSQAVVQFNWDFAQKKLLLANFRINQRQSEGDDGKKYNQNATVTVLPTGEYAVNRSMNVYTSYPGIFSDGPIPAMMGDTVSLYLSARNPDMSIPEISIENMPATATFDPDSDHFFWIVDDENPSPMIYKATREGGKTVMIDVHFQGEQFTVPNEEELSPYSFELAQNYPNPFNPATVISYQLPANSLVSLKVYDLVGREVATLVDARMSAGSHTVNFDATRLSSGMYIYRLQAGSNVQTRKMMLIK